MTDAPLTFANLAALVAIFSSIMGVIFGVLRWAEKMLGPRHDKQLMEVVESLREIAKHPGQSVQCSAQHADIRGLYTEQMKRMTELIQAVQTTAEAVKASAHAAELRDGRLIAELKLISERMDYSRREQEAHHKELRERLAGMAADRGRNA